MAWHGIVFKPFDSKKIKENQWQNNDMSTKAAKTKQYILLPISLMVELNLTDGILIKMAKEQLKIDLKSK